MKAMKRIDETKSDPSLIPEEGLSKSIQNTKSRFDKEVEKLFDMAKQAKMSPQQFDAFVAKMKAPIMGGRKSARKTVKARKSRKTARKSRKSARKSRKAHARR